jgi:hypothetical protein
MSEDVILYIPLTLYPQRGSRGISDIPPRLMLYADVSGGKPIANRSLSRVSAVDPLHPKLIINLNPFLPIRHRNFNPNFCLSVPIMYPHCEL